MQGYQFIADFQEIDPEDRDIVDEINLGQRFAKIRSSRTREEFTEAYEANPTDFEIWQSIITKYKDRITKERISHKINN
jgi:hypothetical protein